MHRAYGGNGVCSEESVVPMIRQKLRRQGNSLVVTIPKDEIERLNLHEGQTLLVDIQPLELRPVLSPGLRAVFEESWRQNEAGYRALAEQSREQ